MCLEFVKSAEKLTSLSTSCESGAKKATNPKLLSDEGEFYLVMHGRDHVMSKSSELMSSCCSDQMKLSRPGAARHSGFVQKTFGKIISLTVEKHRSHTEGPVF